MKRFEYAQPRTESEAVTLLADPSKQTAVLAGGTDLVGLMKRTVVSPDRVVNIREIDSLRHIERDAAGNTWIGAAVCLDEFVADDLTHAFPSVKQVIQGISSIQLQSQGTVVGELLRRPMCWYFRGGQGLLAGGGRRVIDGDNRYHAILGNRGPAKFVSASRLAPPMITLGAQLRVIGPENDSEKLIDLQDLYRIPKAEGESENVLKPGQMVTHLVIPPCGNRLSASYEVRHGEGPDPPLAAAAVSMDVQGGRVQAASLALGQVAPIPWPAVRAAQSLIGNPITQATAQIAAVEAVAGAVALSQNEYKIQLAQVALRRAILKAAGMPTGGLDGPVLSEPSEESRSYETHLA